MLMKIITIPEIIEKYTPVIDGRKNYSALARQLDCDRQLIHRWRKEIGRPHRYTMLAWLASENKYRRAIANEILWIFDDDNGMKN